MSISSYRSQDLCKNIFTISLIIRTRAIEIIKAPEQGDKLENIR